MRTEGQRHRENPPYDLTKRVRTPLSGYSYKALGCMEAKSLPKAFHTRCVFGPQFPVVQFGSSGVSIPGSHRFWGGRKDSIGLGRAGE